MYVSYDFLIYSVFEVSSNNYEDLLLVICSPLQSRTRFKHPKPRGEFSLPNAASKIGLLIAINLSAVKYVVLASAFFEMVIYHLFMKTWGVL